MRFRSFVIIRLFLLLLMINNCSFLSTELDIEENNITNLGIRDPGKDPEEVHEDNQYKPSHGFAFFIKCIKFDKMYPLVPKQLFEEKITLDVIIQGTKVFFHLLAKMTFRLILGAVSEKEGRSNIFGDFKKYFDLLGHWNMTLEAMQNMRIEMTWSPFTLPCVSFGLDFNMCQYLTFSKSIEKVPAKLKIEPLLLIKDILIRDINKILDYLYNRNPAKLLLLALNERASVLFPQLSFTTIVCPDPSFG